MRKTVSWRLPISLLTRIYTRAEIEGLTVTAWVERALTEALQQPRSMRGPHDRDH